MRKALRLEERLAILRENDKERRWYSLDDKRVCAVCGRTFNGRQVTITRGPRGAYSLKCPTEACPSRIDLWFFGVPPHRDTTTRLNGFSRLSSDH